MKKLTAVVQTQDKIILIYSDPENEEMPSYEFQLDDPALGEKLKPHMKERLLQRHLVRHPIKPRDRSEQAGEQDTIHETMGRDTGRAEA